MCRKELCGEHSPEGFVAKDSGENAREILQSSHKQTKYTTLYATAMRATTRPKAGDCRNGHGSQTFMRQNVTSLWQSDVQMILILTSCDLGGSTTISSMASGSPAALHTAAARRRKGKPVSLD